MEVQVINLEDKREYTVIITKAGENTMKCPSCSDERKKKNVKCFSYNRDKEVGKCAHCGIVLHKKKEFVKQDIVYKRPAWKNKTLLSDKLIKWFEGRKISQKTLLEFKISEGKEWMPQTQSEQNVIHFNYFRENELVNIKYRNGNKQFKLFAGGELIFYNIDAIKDQKQIVIVEGEMDALAFHEAGIKNVISVPNGATLQKNSL